MKDLFVLAADSDMQALVRAVLGRHRDLQIRPISFVVQRFTGRDSGMVKEGPEIARALVRKSEFSRLMLVWDHHGSGWHALKAEEAVTRIQERLDGVTWADRSAAVAVVPELEEWLWHCPASIAHCVGSDMTELETMTTRAAAKLSRSRERCYLDAPKELFEAVLYEKRRRRPLPGDYEVLGSSADLGNWSGSATFGRVVDILRAWFPTG